MKKLGLALSGGGYRAAAFHLGTMRKLNEMGILDKVDVLSTVSGGSIVGADYALQLDAKKDYTTFEQNHIKKLKQSVIKEVLTSFNFIKICLGVLLWLAVITCLQFTCWAWVGIILLISGIILFVKYQFNIFPVSKIIEKIYDSIFFSNKTLPDLPQHPVMAINSTNMETGRQFTFSKAGMGDSTYEYSNPPILFDHTTFPVSRSVMASSSVPFAFVPVPIDKKYFKNPSDATKVKPLLVDGGVYDNQGIHKLTQELSKYNCDIVIVSDAGNKMSSEGAFNNLISLLFRCMDLFMNRIKKFQMTDNLYHNVVLKKKEIAYISLGWDLENCISGFVDNLHKGLILPGVAAAQNIPGEFLNPFNAGKIQEHLEKITGYRAIAHQSDKKTGIARSVGTNLTALPDEQISALINHAELMTELQVKLYCPSLLK